MTGGDGRDAHAVTKPRHDDMGVAWSPTDYPEGAKREDS
jgi:hypothetical protein